MEGQKIPERTKELQLLSSGSKIGVQLMWVVMLVILPRFFPNLIQLRYKVSLEINVILALVTSIFYEILKFIYLKSGKDNRWIINLQLLTSVILLTWFLHVFGSINGPFFLLYLLTIMESALNLSTFFPNVVVGIAAAATISEFTWLIFQKEIVFNLYSCLQLLIRLVSLFFMRNYGVSLAQKLITEQKARDQAQKLILKLQDAESQIKSQLSELEEKNQFLATLRRLDLIIMEVLNIETLCQKIVDAISWELKCQFGIIGLINETQNRFYFRAVASDSKLRELLVREKVQIEDIHFPLNDQSNILNKVRETKRELSTDNLARIFHPYPPAETVRKWQEKIKSKTYWIYPIISKGKFIGVFVFAWEKAEREISSQERDLMQSVIDQTGIALDNTLLYEQLKESVRKLKRANLKLRELDRMKDEFVSIASHELRTPMTSINSYLWMVLNKKGGEINPKQRFYLERAAISTQRLINLVNDMLTVSRIEGGKLGVNLVEGDILALAQTITDELQTKAKEKKVKLFLESPSKELPLVVLDSEKIREVLNNLIGNAIKFTDPQGQVVVSFKKKGSFIFTFITDTGRGIAKSDIPKLFKKFGRLDRSFATVAETGGTGLGLYISKQIIDLHHGKIGVESKPGKGSTFYFSLKMARGK